jgi:hypothetical protein
MGKADKCFFILTTLTMSRNYKACNQIKIRFKIIIIYTIVNFSFSHVKIQEIL